ncbi:hypothetical protein KR222_006454, partial [Zaprionus bogoriensis]
PRMTGRFVAVGAYLGMLIAAALVRATPQRAAYSLQAAVDELHRREAAKYPLNAPPPSAHFGADQLDDWDEDSDLFGTGTGTGNKYTKNRNRHRINKAIAKYLERESDNYEPGLGLGAGPSPFGAYEFDDEREQQANPGNLFADEKRKRSSSSAFRERDEQYESGPSGSSVFRERESLAGNSGDPSLPTHSELTEQFLREIEEASEHERQERYKAALRQLWEKYQQQENELRDTAVDDVEQQQQQQQAQLQDQQLFEQKKRMRMPPYYLLMQKKRSSYPVLPWLPYNADKKKRFPVAKRAVAGESPLGKTDERVAQELSELFGKPIEQQPLEEKKKRSTEEQQQQKTLPATTHQPETAATATALGDMRLEINFQRVNVTNGAAKETPTQAPAKAAGTGEMVAHGHAGHHHKHSEHHSDEEYGEEGEESSDEDDHDEFDEDEDGEGEGDGGDAGDRRRKKKRAAGTKHSHSPSVGHLMLRAKKSIDWSQYFGLDRKKKSSDQAADNDSKKRSLGEDSANVEDQNEEAQEKKKKRDIDPEQLESMDKKLQSIEDFIIDETIKYTGAHEGINNQEEIRKLKEHVLSRLATAYSLEKMRRALDKLRQSVDAENHLLRNVIESDSEENSLDNRWSAKKRYSVKKEDVAEEQADDAQQTKKKRSGYVRYPEQPNTMEEALSLNNGAYETLNDAYLGNKNYIIGSNQCPVIESMAERCRSVDVISGDLNQELLPLCGVHQICYLCGASQVACDYQYLAEADSICGSSNECQAAARSVLMILRGTPGRQLGPRECLKNPCLYRAMREIGL